MTRHPRYRRLLLFLPSLLRRPRRIVAQARIRRLPTRSAARAPRRGPLRSRRLLEERLRRSLAQVACRRQASPYIIRDRIRRAVLGLDCALVRPLRGARLGCKDASCSRYSCCQELLRTSSTDLHPKSTILLPIRPSLR